MLKIDELRLIAKNSNAAIIGISESKLDKTVLDNEVKIDGYELKRSDRNRQGGGVACYIRKDLSFNSREDFAPDLENTFFDLLLPKSKPVLVGILYRPPNSNGFLKKLNAAISKTKNFDNQEVFILEDLNIDLTGSVRNSNGIKRYKEFCSLHGLEQLIQEPTRITEKSETLLDHIISNSAQNNRTLLYRCIFFNLPGPNRLSLFRYRMIDNLLCIFSRIIITIKTSHV